MWRNAFGACPDLRRPLCLGRGVPLVPLPGLRFPFHAGLSRGGGNRYATTKLPITFPTTDTRKGAMNSVYHWVRNYMLGRKARLVVA